MAAKQMPGTTPNCCHAAAMDAPNDDQAAASDILNGSQSAASDPRMAAKQQPATFSNGDQAMARDDEGLRIKICQRRFRTAVEQRPMVLPIRYQAPATDSSDLLASSDPNSGQAAIRDAPECQPDSRK